jgi:ABC-2 type transport system ATP-binding protein
MVTGLGHSAEVVDGELRIDAEEEWGAELNRIAFQSGVLLRQITPVRPSLEETFFTMTEEER